jgi:hypothetical protein
MSSTWNSSKQTRRWRCDCRQRIFLALQRIERRVNVAHECMEVHARLAPDRHGREEAVHQEALAAADAAPQVDAAGDVGRCEQPLERRAARRLERGQLVRELLQPLERRHLRVVERRAPPVEQRLEIFDEAAVAARDLPRVLGADHARIAVVGGAGVRG